ncbi:unnamed protein product [Clonostachys solani]|uniref:Uncharacterized protein n=1 Tax=Clonostachys solani TaxID=160281 RepID=A0A9P0EL75_9HYPO|nr:unnamed protein product [Clonostachys solani]
MRLVAIFSFLALTSAVVATDPSTELDQRDIDEINFSDAYADALAYHKRELFTRAIAKNVKHKRRCSSDDDCNKGWQCKRGFCKLTTVTMALQAIILVKMR